ncbi:MAG: hypothetical protein ACTTJG_08860, partial [Treponema sp.]
LQPDIADKPQMQVKRMLGGRLTEPLFLLFFDIMPINKNKGTKKMATPTEERNNRIIKIMNCLYQKAVSTEPIEIEDFSEKIEELFRTNVWGFREVVLTVAVAMLDKTDFPNFKASKDFYDCNPRAIYEQPIKTVLIEKNLPHRQSGPLNVAKGQHNLDGEWISKRSKSDQPICRVAVELINLMESDEEFIEPIGISIMRHLLAEKQELKQLDIEINPTSDPYFLYHACERLIIMATDGGNTPQRICGYLLGSFHKSMQTNIIVTGSNDSASTTSTTSKKPGDINEEASDGTILNVYEITVKSFNESRVRDSYNCIMAYNSEYNTNLTEIIVICRPEDCHPDMQPTKLKGTMGNYLYNGINYRYWNIFEWLSFTLQHTPADGREMFYSELNSYISDINTSQTVKKCWQEIHS